MLSNARCCLFLYVDFVLVVKVTNSQMRLVAHILVVHGQGSFWADLRLLYRFQTAAQPSEKVRFWQQGIED